ncbi:MAG: ATP-binding protein [Syntrophobacteraceae bacterium]
MAQKSSFYLVLVFVALTIGIGAVGHHYYLKQRDHIRRQQWDDLSAIERLKTNEIAWWLRERIQDGQVILENPMLISQLKKWLEGPEDPDLSRQIVAWVESLVEHYDYQSAQIVDAHGTVRLAVAEEAEVECKESLARAVKARKPVFSTFRMHERTKEPHFCLFIPIFASMELESALVGVISLRIDPSKFLAPFLQVWPNQSNTAETLLVRREGDEVVFLNELRHRSDSALMLRVPLDSEKLPAAIAARGYEGILEGIDYRGVPVLAAVGPIPGSPWFLVAKVDQEEIYQPIRDLAWFIVAIVGALIGVAAVTLALVWSRREAVFLRAQYETELERLELARRYEHLMKYANDAVILADINGGIIEANERAAASYGYEYNELVRMNARELRAPEALATLEEEWRKIREQGGAVFETLHRTKDGRVFPVEISSRVLEIGGRDHYWGFIRDISERKEAEEALRRAYDELEERVRERTAELLELNEALKSEINERVRIETELKRSNEALQDFAFIASHDLQEPLRKIQVFGELLQSKSGKVLDESCRDYLDRMQKAAVRMKTLIRALLDYSRVSTRAQPFLIIDMNKVVRGVLSVLEVRIQTSGAEIEVGDLPPLEADPNQMHQLFQNLVGNALKFVRSEKPIIRIYAEEEKGDGSHRIIVEDNGIGFEEQYAERIFVPFERLHGHGAFPGTGMGLAICKKIVERHGGSIEARGTPGRGAAFIVCIPSKQPGKACPA